MYSSLVALLNSALSVSLKGSNDNKILTIKYFKLLTAFHEKKIKHLDKKNLEKN